MGSLSSKGSDPSKQQVSVAAGGVDLNYSMKEESNQDMSCDSDDDVKEETTSSEDDDEDSFDANMKGDDF